MKFRSFNYTFSHWSIWIISWKSLAHFAMHCFACELKASLIWFRLLCQTTKLVNVSLILQNSINLDLVCSMVIFPQTSPWNPPQESKSIQRDPSLGIPALMWSWCQYKKRRLIACHNECLSARGTEASNRNVHWQLQSCGKQIRNWSSHCICLEQRSKRNAGSGRAQFIF